ncbi:hypothetical protein B0H11DRAFT_2099993 [Mycena galericulata]|nr:hypothetical protein B0H11DRAFT_2099993 [Mycena galericulata]
MSARSKPRTNMSLRMPAYTPELEYSLDLGAETPPPDNTAASAAPPALPRTRSWRALNHASEKKRSGAYDEDGNLTVAARGRRAAERDCGICEEPATEPVRTQCCGALFCREHIHDWIYGPSASDICPACNALCVLPPSDSASLATEKPRPRTPPSSRSHSPSPPSASSLSSTSTSNLTGDSPKLNYAPLTPPTKALPRSLLSNESLVRVLSVLGLLLLLGLLSQRGGGAERGAEAFGVSE